MTIWCPALPWPRVSISSPSRPGLGGSSRYWLGLLPHLNVRHSFHFFNSAWSSHPAAGSSQQSSAISAEFLNYELWHRYLLQPYFYFYEFYCTVAAFRKYQCKYWSAPVQCYVDTSARSSRHFTPHADTMKLSAQMSRSRTHSSWLNYHEIDLMITIMPTYNLQSPVYVRYCLSGHPACLVTACDPCPW